MKLSQLEKVEFDALLKSENGVSFYIGPYLVNVSSEIPLVAKDIYSLYSDYCIESESHIADMHIQILHGKGIHRFYNKQAIFSNDGTEPFAPLSLDHAYALFEWGLNWVIATQSHQYMMIHAAVVEKNGRVVIMPGSPGAGKSTLCAALIYNGWRLFSDELALISLSDLTIMPVPRPVSLKNESISIISQFLTSSTFGTVAKDTHKGTVSHLKPPVDSVVDANTSAAATHIIFPKFIKGHRTDLISYSKSRAFMEITQQTFNYHILGIAGFDCMADLIEKCDCYQFFYSDLSEGISAFNDL